MSSGRASHIELTTKMNPQNCYFDQQSLSLQALSSFFSPATNSLSANGYALKWEFSYFIYLSAMFCPTLSICYNLCLSVLENKVRTRLHSLETVVTNNFPTTTYTEIHLSLIIFFSLLFEFILRLYLKCAPQFVFGDLFQTRKCIQCSSVSLLLLTRNNLILILSGSN